MQPFLLSVECLLEDHQNKVLVDISRQSTNTPLRVDIVVRLLRFGRMFKVDYQIKVSPKLVWNPNDFHCVD